MTVDAGSNRWRTRHLSPKAQMVRTEALSLSASDRASLAHDLILSLDEPAALVMDQEQEQEIGRRVLAVREGTAQGRPAADVFRDIKATCGNHSSPILSANPFPKCSA